MVRELVKAFGCEKIIFTTSVQKMEKIKCISVKWSLNCSVYILYKILCSSSCRVKCAYASFPLSKQSRQLRCDCHSSS